MPINTEVSFVGAHKTFLNDENLRNISFARFGLRAAAHVASLTI